MPIPQLTRGMARMQETAWTEFHGRYFHRLLAYALRLHQGNRAQAEDTVQAACLRAVRHIRRFQEEEAFWGWLTLLLRCAAADQGRKQVSGSRLEKALAEETLTFSRNASHPAPPAERLLLLEEALRQLAPEERQLLDEKYVHGRSTTTLAEARQVSAKSIENRLRRLRRHLKSAIHSLARRTHG